MNNTLSAYLPKRTLTAAGATLAALALSSCDLVQAAPAAEDAAVPDTASDTEYISPDTADELLATIRSGGQSASLSYGTASTMGDLRRANRLRVGINYDQPLFGYMEDGADSPEGFEVELAKIVAEELAIEEQHIEWVEVTDRNRQQMLENDEVDMIVATYTITHQRREALGFAGPYFTAGQSMLTGWYNESLVRNEYDLIDQPVCALEGSVSEEELIWMGADVTSQSEIDDCLEMLDEDEVVAFSADNTHLAGVVQENPGEYRVIGEPFTYEPYGIAIDIDDDNFRMWLNDLLETAYDDGRYEEAWMSTIGETLEMPEDGLEIDRYVR
ncbi:transporter substrate-binding domain-containing protein [Nesterenkonia populi]